MKCPYCSGTRSKVLATRKTDRAVYRIRECIGCDRRQVTSEQHYGYYIPQEAIPARRKKHDE